MLASHPAPVGRGPQTAAAGGCRLPLPGQSRGPGRANPAGSEGRNFVKAAAGYWSETQKDWYGQSDVFPTEDEAGLCLDSALTNLPRAQGEAEAGSVFAAFAADPTVAPHGRDLARQWLEGYRFWAWQAAPAQGAGHGAYRPAHRISRLCRPAGGVSGLPAPVGRLPGSDDPPRWRLAAGSVPRCG